MKLPCPKIEAIPWNPVDARSGLHMRRTAGPLTIVDAGGKATASYRTEAEGVSVLISWSGRDRTQQAALEGLWQNLRDEHKSAILWILADPN